MERLGNMVHGVLHELVDRLPNVDGTPKYCQNALEVAVGPGIWIVHDPTAKSEAFWQYFGVPSTLGRRSTSSCKTQASCKTPCTTLCDISLRSCVPTKSFTPLY